MDEKGNANVQENGEWTWALANVGKREQQLYRKTGNGLGRWQTLENVNSKSDASVKGNGG